MNVIERPDPPCPLCGSGETFEFLRRPGVPVHQHLLLDDPDAARNVRRGNLVMRLCEQCGFGFNAAFRPELLDYGQSYDNTQNWSAEFDAYVDGLVRELIETEGVRDCRVVEVGCGKGTFLKKLVSYPASGIDGHGFDPTYLGPETDLEGRVRFTRTFYDGRANLPADAAVCRHVIEHVPEPLELLQGVREGLAGAPHARVFFETPCLNWILRGQVVWDFFYEHCSLFTASSLATAFARAGFGDVRVRHAFAGQYLWLKARLDEGRPPAVLDPGETPRLARAFALRERDRMRGWQALARRLAGSGRVAVWGAGAKGVTFCNVVDPRSEWISCVVDVNPAKQGKYVAGSGHRILGPDRLGDERVGAVLVLNPNYTREIAALLTRLGSSAVVVDAMHAEWRDACA